MAAVDGHEAESDLAHCGTVRAALAGVVLAAISLAACGGGNPVNTGPFGGRNYIGEATCSVPLRHGVFTDSDLAFSNAGPAAVIDKVGFTHIRGLRLLAAYAVLNLERAAVTAIGWVTRRPNATSREECSGHIASALTVRTFHQRESPTR